MNPATALLLSIAIVLVLLRFRLQLGAAILVGSLVLALFFLPPVEIPRAMAGTLTSTATLRLLAIVICALTMSHIMDTRGHLALLASALESIGPKVAIHVVPAAIGLIPLPGGAVVSAAATKDLARRLGLAPAQEAFINYWFRHVCDFASPLNPGIILTGVLLAAPLSFVLIHIAPIWMLMVSAGVVLSSRILRSPPLPSPTESSLTSVAEKLLRSTWPIALVFTLVIAGLDAAPAFLVTVLALMAQQRMPFFEVKAALKHGFSPKIVFMLCSVMFFKAVVEASGVAQSLYAEMQATSMPPIAILMALPFLIGLSTGLSSAMVGIAIPLVTPFILAGGDVSGMALMLAYGCGGLGHLLSPLHPCLVLSTEYLKARLVDVYSYLLPPAAVMLAGTTLIYLFL
ncbi:DUF401 family protein [Chloroflexota bacterium]